MTTRYLFFQDESFHDLKLTEKNGKINYENDDSLSYFVNVFVGIPSSRYLEVENKYLEWEQSEKKYVSGQDVEFKGESIKAKNYKFGLASMNLKYIKFYSFLFDLIADDFVIQISTINKFELIINKIFSPDLFILETIGINPDFFMYGFIKFLYRHKTEKLSSMLFNSDITTEEIISEITNISLDVMLSEKDLSHLSSEVEFAKFLLTILPFFIVSADKRIESDYHWDYDWTVDGLKKLFLELNIPKNEINIILDGKSYRTEGLYKAVCKVIPHYQVEREESNRIAGIRVADFLSNLIGRILRSIQNELNLSRTNITEITYLNMAWFEMRKEVFELYQKIGSFFAIRSGIYWTSQRGRYADAVVVFYRLIECFTQFDSFEGYSNIAIEEHRKNLNCITVNFINTRY